MAAIKKVAELVFIPAPGLGHLVPSIEFAKRLLSREDRFSVTVLVIRPPSVHDKILTQVESLAASNTPIKFINLPRIDHDDHPPSLDRPKSLEKLFSDILDSHKPYVKEAIIKHAVSNSNSPPLAGLVVDFFCTSMIDVANELGAPSYLFFPSTAAFLGLMLSLPTRHDQGGREFEEFDADSVFTTYVNPVPSRVLPSFLFNKYGGYNTLLNHARRFKETKGIILNSYAELESHAVNSLLNTGHDIPPVYTVGPLIDVKGESELLSNELQRDMILKWLDDQPCESVVFLCFGSLGSFGEEQVKEIASGLEQSGVRFLWSLRKPPPKDKFEVPSDFTSIREALPNGFLERTKEKGMVCGWAPQKAILAHTSIGGFVSHCGWNSTLESVWFGVPIVTWPMYAEQQINAFQMVKDLGLAVEMKLDYRNTSGEVVLGDEIARAIRSVTDSDNKVRKNIKEASEKSRLAVIDHGSSYAAYGHFIEDVIGNKI